MNENDADHAALEVYKIFERVAMHICADFQEGIRTRHAKHLVSRANQFIDDGGPGKADGVGNKYTHKEFHFSVGKHSVTRSILVKQ
jgi:hypothetical protein